MLLNPLSGDHPGFFFSTLANNLIKCRELVIVSYSSDEGFPNRKKTLNTNTISLSNIGSPTVCNRSFSWDILMT